MNHGVIIRPPEADDFIFGAAQSTRVPLLAPGISWDFACRPEGEKQWTTNTDTMACVSFSALNVLEWVMNYKIKNKILSIGSLRWLHDNGYLDHAGLLNVSDRFTAKMSGTTHDGNYLSAVGNSIRNDGVVPESVWPFTPTGTWEEYYSDIPDSIKQLGHEFSARFMVTYEAVKMTEAATALRYSPIQIIVHAWNGTDANGVYVRTDADLNHAVTLYKLPPANYEIFDHYYKGPDISYAKALASNFNIYEWGYIYSIEEKNMLDVRKLQKDGKRILLGVPSGKMYYNKDGVLLEITEERAGKAALMVLIASGFGTGVDDDNIKAIDKGTF